MDSDYAVEKKISSGPTSWEVNKTKKSPIRWYLIGMIENQNNTKKNRDIKIELTVDENNQDVEKNKRRREGKEEGGRWGCVEKNKNGGWDGYG